MPTGIRQFRELNAEVEFSLRNILRIYLIQMLEVRTTDAGLLTAGKRWKRVVHLRTNAAGDSLRIESSGAGYKPSKSIFSVA